MKPSPCNAACDQNSLNTLLLLLKNTLSIAILHIKNTAGSLSGEADYKYGSESLWGRNMTPNGQKYQQNTKKAYLQITTVLMMD